ncbi:MAG: glycine cleavage system aminomethyltransferase GcvT [Acholeplasmataceae bacterium]|jgi:aminomethyltransferase|nr:glycine cleavage system aminomethyltransferase GcvT [Acholeplasmataceae bacterium]
MKTTVLHDKHLALNAKMIEYAGFHMPVSYAGITEEHLAVRTGMGIFDVSHMGEFMIEGKDALPFVNNLVTNLILPDTTKVTYALMCDESGFVVDDLLVYVIKEDKILLVVNAGNIDKDFAWVVKQTEKYDVTARNISNDIAQIAIQGPLVKENIEKIVGTTGDDLSFMTYKTIPFEDGHVIFSRTGYTGEDGFEVYGKPEFISKMWDSAISMGVIPCGLGSRDTLRFEANLPLYGHEISESINPVEAGLNFAIKLDKENFIGKDALVSYKENPKRKVVGLELLERNIPRHGYAVYKDDQEIGMITTGYLLPQVTTPVACALVPIEHAAIGTELYVQIRQNKVLAKVRNRKFYTKKYNK